MIYDWSEIERSGKKTNEGERNYTRVYQALSDSALDSEMEVWAHPKCPIPLVSFLPEDPLAICLSVDPKLRKRSQWTWDVTAQFGTVRPQAWVPGEDPTADPADVTSTTEVSMEEVYIDRDNLPTWNTAGDLVQVKVPVPRTTYKVVKNVSTVNAWIERISGIVNDGPCRLKGTLYPRGTLMLWHVELGKDDIRNNIPFFQAQLTIKHKQEGWETGYLNIGYNELRLPPDAEGDPSKAKTLDPKTKKAILRKQRCLDGPTGNTGEPVNSPVFLNEFGWRERVYVENELTHQYERRVKDPLDLSDILIIKRRFVDYYDFNKLPLR